MRTPPEDPTVTVATSAGRSRPNPARAALGHRAFRRVFMGATLSNMGTWMQNVVLTAYAYKLTDSAAFVGIITFAQLGPHLVLPLVGGLIADRVDRRRLLLTLVGGQVVLSLALSAVTSAPDPSRLLLVAVVVLIGSGQALFGPPFGALLPTLVPRDLLAGAISLNSVSMNASRVIGPALGGIAFHQVGASWVFLGNAITSVFIIGALSTVQLPATARPREAPGRRSELAEAFQVVRTDRVVARCLGTVAAFSLLCLVFIGQMPVLADRNLHIDPESSGYGLLYALFGVGAFLGALAVGSVLSHLPRQRLARTGLVAFASLLSTLALLRAPVPAYPVIMVLGFFYFMAITAFSTALQERLHDAVRGRIMAMWMMAFGGAVSAGNLILGPVIGAIGITPVMLGGAVVALVLVPVADLRVPPGAPELVGVPTPA